MEASTTSKPTMWILTIAVTFIACSTVVSIDRDTTEGCSIVIFWMAKTQMFNLRQVFAERRQILEDFFSWFNSQVWKFVPQKSNDLSNRTFTTFWGHEKKTTQTMHFFSRKSPKFPIFCLHQVLNPPEVMGPIEVMTPVVASAEIVRRDVEGQLPGASGLDRKNPGKIGDPRLSFSDTSQKLLAIKLCKLYGFLNNKQVCNRVYLICIGIRIVFRRTIWNSLNIWVLS